jgi:hypothetical protein
LERGERKAWMRYPWAAWISMKSTGNGGLERRVVGWGRKGLTSDFLAAVDACDERVFDSLDLLFGHLLGLGIFVREGNIRRPVYYLKSQHTRLSSMSSIPSSGHPPSALDATSVSIFLDIATSE